MVNCQYFGWVADIGGTLIGHGVIDKIWERRGA